MVIFFRAHRGFFSLTNSKTLRQLTEEREELDKVFRLAESLENQKRDEEKTKKLTELIKTKGMINSHCTSHARIRCVLSDELQSEIQNEKTAAVDLDAKLREWEKKIRQKQTEIGGANAAITFNATVRKQERVLENRLDTVGNFCARDR